MLPSFPLRSVEAQGDAASGTALWFGLLCSLNATVRGSPDVLLPLCIPRLILLSPRMWLDVYLLAILAPKNPEPDRVSLWVAPVLCKRLRNLQM